VNRPFVHRILLDPLGKVAGQMFSWPQGSSPEGPYGMIQGFCSRTFSGIWIGTKYINLKTFAIESGWWWLEAWNVMTFHSVGNIFYHPNWRTPSFFRGVGLNHQPGICRGHQSVGTGLERLICRAIGSEPCWRNQPGIGLGIGKS